MGLHSTSFLSRIRFHPELNPFIVLPPRLFRDWVTLRLVLSYSVCHLLQLHLLVRFKVHALPVCPEKHCLVSMLLAYVSDRYRCRGLVVIVCGILCAIGFAMYLGWFSVRFCIRHYLTSSRYLPRFIILPREIWFSLLEHLWSLLLCTRSIHVDGQQLSAPYKARHCHRHWIYNDKFGGHLCDLALRNSFTAAPVQEGMHHDGHFLANRVFVCWSEYLVPH